MNDDKYPKWMTYVLRGLYANLFILFILVYII